MAPSLNSARAGLLSRRSPPVSPPVPARRSRSTARASSPRTPPSRPPPPFASIPGGAARVFGGHPRPRMSTFGRAGDARDLRWAAARRRGTCVGSRLSGRPAKVQPLLPSHFSLRPPWLSLLHYTRATDRQDDHHERWPAAHPSAREPGPGECTRQLADCSSSSPATASPAPSLPAKVDRSQPHQQAAPAPPPPAQ